MELILRVVCAWCSTVEVEGSTGAPVSHTICVSCLHKHFPEVDTPTDGVDAFFRS